MLEKRFHKGNTYFDTYYIRDTKNDKFVGIIEDHCIGVAEQYFIGWKFKDNKFIPNMHQEGKTKMFDTYEEALNYIQEDFNL
jgi:hypothetical protein